MNPNRLHLEYNKLQRFQRTRAMVTIWETLRKLLEGEEQTAARLVIEAGGVKYRGVRAHRKTVAGADAANGRYVA